MLISLSWHTFKTGNMSETKTNFKLTFQFIPDEGNRKLIDLTTTVIDEILYSRGFRKDDNHHAVFSLSKTSENGLPRIREDSYSSKNIDLTNLVRTEDSVNRIIQKCILTSHDHQKK